MKSNEVAFSHRPTDGISVGVTVNNGFAYLSVGFVREGDAFNRKLARRILSQRIESTFSGKKVRFVTLQSIPDKVDARSIIREFRKLFKPDPTCLDDIFATVTNLDWKGDGNINSVPVRQPLSRDAAWNKINNMFVKAVQSAIDAKVSA